MRIIKLAKPMYYPSLLMNMRSSYHKKDKTYIRPHPEVTIEQKTNEPKKLDVLFRYIINHIWRDLRRHGDQLWGGVVYGERWWELLKSLGHKSPSVVNEKGL